jgi:hypothetical protein
MLPKYVTAVQIASNDQLKKSSLTFEALAFMASMLRPKRTGGHRAFREFAHSARSSLPRAGVTSSKLLQTTFPAVRPGG